MSSDFSALTSSAKALQSPARLMPPCSGSQKFDISELLLSIFVGAAFLFLASTVIWGLNRGFDLTDEGYYLVLVSDPAKYVAPTAFHFVLAKLPALTGCKLIDLRIFQLFSQILSCSLLALGFWRLHANHSTRPSSMQLFTSVTFTVVSSFLLQSIFPPSISYNGLTYFLIFSSFGLLFFAASSVEKDAKHTMLLSGLAGFLCGFELQIKFTACILSALLGISWIFLNRKQRPLIKSYLLGLISAPVFFLCVFQSPQQFIDQLEEIRRYAAISTTHSANSIFHKTLDNFCSTLSTILTNFGLTLFLPVLSALISVITEKSGFPGRRLVIYILALLCLVPSFFLVSAKQGMYYKSYVDLHASIILSLLVLLIFSLARFGNALTQIRAHMLYFSTFCVLLLLPFACSFGTANPIFFQSISCIAPVFLALSAISMLVIPAYAAVPFRFVILGGLTSLVVAIFVRGYFEHPYLLYSSLAQQDQAAAELNNLRGVKLSQESLNFLCSANRILVRNDFHQGDSMMSLFDIPGAVYALGGKEVGASWLLSLAAFKDFRPAWYRHARHEVKDKLYVLASWDLSQKTRDSLREAGFDFPDDFEYLGAADMKPYSYGLVETGTGDRYLLGAVRLYKWRGKK